MPSPEPLYIALFMDEIRERVRVEMAAFEEQLPDLLRHHPGKWIVFRDKTVHSTHESEAAAYSAAVKEFGYAGGFVIAQVLPRPPTPLTAAFLFTA